jgi:hypothetical protein
MGEVQPAQCQCPACLARAAKLRARIWRGLIATENREPPTSLLRYVAAFITALIWVALGHHTQLGDWLWVAIIGGFFLLPDVASLGFAGFSIQLRKTKDELKDEIASIRNDVRVGAMAGNYNINLPPGTTQEQIVTVITAVQRVNQAANDLVEPYKRVREGEEPGI